ncbi:hypothetical protein MWU78_14610 [Arenibacter sp. F26102]|uniref:DUF6503 family protein n=1 Tax=Arenibacter sp. F26102 TaxID=2926416 RepID=UPI001FF51E54|nr:DUF6503 family protein [Arenibacter sp. F26102]MCK0146885.1 hypothetical protein [Arenibacter sp. F26102]
MEQLKISMMKYMIVVLMLTGVLSCKMENKAKEVDMELAKTKTESKINLERYPEPLLKVFEAHGGIVNWKNKKSLVFKQGQELHTIDLQSRMDRVDGPAYSLGFDGDKVWLLNEENAFKGDPVFYHNLRSYFFNMPFVLGDKGIVYDETEDLVYEGVNYPGIAVRFNSGIGTSYKDEYFLHYDPQTFEMAWLGYTVSYRSGERSDNVSWIGYHDWTEVNGLKVPKELTWYSSEGRTIKEPRKPVVFEAIEFSEQPKPISFFAKPENGIFVEGKVQE